MVDDILIYWDAPVLGHTSLHVTFTKFVYVWLRKSCFLNDGQFKAGFVKKIKTQGWISTHCSWSSCSSRRSKSHFLFFMIICESRLLFHRREGRGEQSSLACKEICTDTSHCEQSCFWQGKKGVVLPDHWDQFNHTTLWKMGIRCPLWSTATTILRLNTDLKS